MRAGAVLSLLLLATISTPVVQAQQPDIVQEHWYHSYATLTTDVNAWADDYPDIVDLVSAGQTELGRELWVVRLSNWANETKPDGSEKEIVYIDGGHHGNEHLGTELAFLTAEYYIEGWATGDEEVKRVFETTELHILIMLNADGNDINTRWNINQVDLNRNYDHHWNEHDETQPGSGPFSEAETRANSQYMNDVVSRADLYVTMHTGVWIMLYPWGLIPEQPSDWELFYSIREDIHANISQIPVRNANQGLYPNSGTSRDYGYGIMGFPTFTFETDDEQWLPGTAESLSDRLGEELDVMQYLISNIWYWRARLNVNDLIIGEDTISATVVNNGRASTTNASLWWIPDGFDIDGALLDNSITDGNRSFSFPSDEGPVMIGDLFAVNASNSTTIEFDRVGGIDDSGSFILVYQKRVIDASMAVAEHIDGEDVEFVDQEDDDRWLGGWGILDPFSFILGMLAAAWWVSKRT